MSKKNPASTHFF